MLTIKVNLTNKFSYLVLGAIATVSFACAPETLAAQESSASQNAAEQATYEDLAWLAERADMVIRARIRRQSQVSPDRAPGLKPGFARLYIEADTLALIAGRNRIGESLAYLVDVPLNAKGKPPKLKKREVILFADIVPGRPITRRGQEIRLVAPSAQLDYSPQLEARLRPILSELATADRPPVIEGVADALAVPGTLAGESETQIFLKTADGSPVSITVLRRPGLDPVWGVSWGEIIDSAAQPPQPQTLRWYRLACFLPRELPSSANLARDANARRLAANDYAFVIGQLGECRRTITE